ncbi:unnamed protein product [Ophioblennius macclurei]
MMFMEACSAVVLSLLMGVGVSSVFSLTSPKASPQGLKIINCVFFERVNVTCHWKHNNENKETNYTLMIWEARGEGDPTSDPPLSCSTTSTNCTVELKGLTTRAVFCTMVTAHINDQKDSSPRRCERGRKEVKLPSVELKNVTPLGGSSQCLGVEWKQPKPSEFPVSKEEIKSGSLNSQIEYRAEEDRFGKVKDVNVTGFWFKVCGFRPDTTYHVKLRHRLESEASPWSEWSKPLRRQTGEPAPSSAPVFWRQLKESPRSGWRLVFLVWKPLPPASGRVLFYNVTCQTESAVPSSLDGCRHLDVSTTSCSVHLPVHRCSCTLTASNSGGASPKARLWLPDVSEQVPMAPSHVSVSPLNDSSLEVGWTVPADSSVSGFVVEWFAVGEKNSSVIHWEKLNQSSRTLRITEGLKPLERYAVSVRVLYGEQQMEGENRSQLIYTREGAPSAGPDLIVDNRPSLTVDLSWRSLPMDQLRGFLQSYTLYITGPQPRNLIVASDANRFTVDRLPPGNYKFSLGANTGGGSGPAGTGVNVRIASETPVVAYVILSLILTPLMLLSMVFLMRFKMMNKKLGKAIPDPSNSSLSHWIPKTDLERKKQIMLPDQPEVNCSEIMLLGEVEPVDPDQDQSYQNTSSVWTHLSKQPSPLHDEMLESALLYTNLSVVKTSSIPNLSAHPLVLSDLLFSQLPKNLALSLLCSIGDGSGDWQRTRSTHSVGNVKQLPGGAAEPPHLPPADIACPSLRQHQGLASLSDFSSTSHSSFSPQAEVTSSKQSVFNSFPSLQCNIFPSLLTPFSDSIVVDPSYSSLQCDSYIPFNS